MIILYVALYVQYIHSMSADRSSLKIQPAHLQRHRYRTEGNRTPFLFPGIELSQNFMLTLTQWQTLHSSSTQDPDLKKETQCSLYTMQMRQSCKKLCHLGPLTNYIHTVDDNAHE
jgi:hypothetical protein